MAQITQVKLVDDLDGGEAAESVSFSLDGKTYEIDLSEKHAAALRDAGVPVRLTNYLRVPHGFAFTPGAAPAVGRQQRWELAAELSTALNAPR